MAKVTYARLTAECGHTYTGYTSDAKWARCRQCMTTLRLNMQAENAYRRYLLAVARAGRVSYYIPPKVRSLVYERDGWICQLCFDPVDRDLDARDIWSATLDHIVCRSWTTEPDHSPSNLRLAHRWCNSVRGNESNHRPSVLLPPSAA